MLNKTHRLEKEAKWRKIWGGNWWPKIADFCWLILKRRILAWDNIQVRGFSGPSRCSLCENNIENLNHLLDECPISTAIWERGTGLFKTNRKHIGRPDITIVEWAKNIFKNKLVNRIWELFPGFVVWEFGKPVT